MLSPYDKSVDASLPAELPDKVEAGAAAGPRLIRYWAKLSLRF